MRRLDLDLLLHLPCQVQPFAAEGSPLFLQRRYSFYEVCFGEVKFLAVEPQEPVPLPAMRKNRAALSAETGLECAIILDRLSPYQKKRMLEEGIPFICPGKELYLPFLGVVLASGRKKQPTSAEQISFMTQRLLLTVLYRHIHRATGTELAKELQISGMSATRCLDELEALLPSLIRHNGRSRVLTWDAGWRDYWETIKPALRNPVIKEYWLEEPVNMALPLGGMSTISHYTMLNDNPYPTYAVTRAKASELGLSKLRQVPKGEYPLAVIQVTGYEIPIEDSEVMSCDPLSAVLALSNQEEGDPRVESAVEEIERMFVK